MRTTVTIDESLVSELAKLSGAKNKTAAVTLAVKEPVRRAKPERLAGLFGKVKMNDKAVEATGRT